MVDYLKVLFGKQVDGVMMYAQKTYESLLEEGKVWKMEYKAVLPSEYGEYYSYENVVLQGRPVKSTPRHDIYIKDGRKVVR